EPTMDAPNAGAQALMAPEASEQHAGLPYQAAPQTTIQLRMAMISLPALISSVASVWTAARDAIAYGTPGVAPTGLTGRSIPSPSGTSLFGRDSPGSSVLWFFLLGGAALTALRFLERRTIRIPAGICLAANSPPG